MKKRWAVVPVVHSIYEGLTLDEGGDGCPRAMRPSKHRTFVGADWHRRFRASYPTLGNRWVVTSIVHVGADPTDPDPRIAGALMPLWAVLYFVSNRWDGLRYGRDRDRRS